MKRPLCVIGAAFALAMRAAFYFDRNASLMLGAAVGITGLFLLILRHDRLRAASLAAFAAASAFGVYSLYYNANILPFQEASGKSVTIEGVITQGTKYSGSVRYTLKARFPDSSLPDTTLLVRLYGDLEHSSGDAVRCEVMLSMPDKASIRDYYRYHGIAATGHAYSGIELLDESPFPSESLIIRLRSRLYANLYAKLPPVISDVTGEMVMSLGDTIPPDISTGLARSGVIHLLSVSGMHLSIISNFVLASLMRLRLSRRASSLLTLLCSIAFTIVTGFAAPIVRACIMTALMLLSYIFSRKSDSLTAPALAVLIICVIWPQWTQGLGLWLSAASTLGIILYSKKWGSALYRRFSRGVRLYDSIVKALVNAAAVCLSAYAVTFPILLFGYGWISLVAPLANILVAPFVPVVIFGGIICAFVSGNPLPIRFIAAITEFSARMILHISSLFSRLPFSTASIDQAYLLIWLAFIVITALILVLFKADMKLISYGAAACALVLAVGGLSYKASTSNKIELITLEDCGSALLLRGREAVILGAPTRYDINRLMRYLDYRGVRNINAVAAPDQGNQIDSGFIRLGDNYTIGCVIGPDDSYIISQLSLALPDVPVYHCGYAEITMLGGAKISFDRISGDMRIQIGPQKILKTDQKYVIIKKYAGHTIRLYRDGAALLPDTVYIRPEPVGARLYGETRILLEV